MFGIVERKPDIQLKADSFVEGVYNIPDDREFFFNLLAAAKDMGIVYGDGPHAGEAV